MTEHAFAQLADAVKTLEFPEPRWLRNLIDYQLSLPPSQEMDKMVELMLRKGTLSQVPPPRDPNRVREWVPVEIPGEPLSQTIIAARR